MLGLPDSYTVRARIFPAVIAAVPALALIFAFVPWHKLSLSQGLSGVALLAVIWFFSDRARRKGKEIEPYLYAKMGGMPSTTMLRHRDEAFDDSTKRRIHAYLADKLGAVLPTAEDEAADPFKADAFYARGATWLREHTRDTKKFNILFDENMTYGARRNLLGLKWYALFLDFSVAAVSLAMILLGVPLAIEEAILSRWSVVLMVAALHALCMAAYVNEEGVFQAARQYARQLLLSYETLASDETIALRAPRGSATSVRQKKKPS